MGGKQKTKKVVRSIYSILFCGYYFFLSRAIIIAIKALQVLWSIFGGSVTLTLYVPMENEGEKKKKKPQ
jgi:hypothetical protein